MVYGMCSSFTLKIIMYSLLPFPLFSFSIRSRSKSHCYTVFLQFTSMHYKRLSTVSPSDKLSNAIICHSRLTPRFYFSFERLTLWSHHYLRRHNHQPIQTSLYHSMQLCSSLNPFLVTCQRSNHMRCKFQPNFQKTIKRKCKSVAVSFPRLYSCMHASR